MDNMPPTICTPRNPKKSLKGKKIVVEFSQTTELIDSDMETILE
jgi:hypothetical protein